MLHVALRHRYMPVAAMAEQIPCTASQTTPSTASMPGFRPGVAVKPRSRAAVHPRRSA